MSEVHYHETGCQCGDCRKERGDHAGYEQALVTIAALRAQNARLVVRVGVLEAVPWCQDNTCAFCGCDQGDGPEELHYDGCWTESALRLTDADAESIVAVAKAAVEYEQQPTVDTMLFRRLARNEGPLIRAVDALTPAARSLLDGARC